MTLGNLIHISVPQFPLPRHGQDISIFGAVYMHELISCLANVHYNHSSTMKPDTLECTFPALCWTRVPAWANQRPLYRMFCFVLISAANDPGKLSSSNVQMSSVQGSTATPQLIRGSSSTLQRQFLCLATAEVLLSSSLLLLTIHPGPPACPPNNTG